MESLGRKRILSRIMLKRLVQTTKSNPFMAARELKKELNVTASVEAIRRKLKVNNLNAYSSRSFPPSMLQNGCRSQMHMYIGPSKCGGTCYGRISPKRFFLVETVPDLLSASHLIVN